MSYAEVEMDVLRWGEARGIVKNGKAISQAIKTLEETTELLDAMSVMLMASVTVSLSST